MSSGEGGGWSVVNGCDVDGLGGHGVAAIAIGDHEVNAVGVVEVSVVEVLIWCVGVGRCIGVIGDLSPIGGDARDGECVAIGIREAG